MRRGLWRSQSQKFYKHSLDLSHPTTGIVQLLTFKIAILMLTAIAIPLSAAGLMDGYRSMYDLDFGAAHQKFASWKQANPDDPMGPVSNAAAYLFSELERLHVLDSELFVDDDKFKLRQHLTASPETKRAFENELASARESARTGPQPRARRPERIAGRRARAWIGGGLSIVDRASRSGCAQRREGRARTGDAPSAILIPIVTMRISPSASRIICSV